MGLTACSAQSSPVGFRARCYTRLQGLRSSWDNFNCSVFLNFGGHEARGPGFPEAVVNCRVVGAAVMTASLKEQPRRLC
jgi:hypothetical protein